MAKNSPPIIIIIMAKNSQPIIIMAKKLNSPPVAAPQLSACVSGQEREQPGNNNQSESSLEVKTQEMRRTFPK